MEINKINEISIVNRGKIAYLQRENIFQERIEKITRNGMEQWAFIYILTDSVRDFLKKYDEDIKLKKYNSCFKNMAYKIAKCKELEK